MTRSSTSSAPEVSAELCVHLQAIVSSEQPSQKDSAEKCKSCTEHCFPKLGRPEKLFSNEGNFTKMSINSASMLSKEKA